MKILTITKSAEFQIIRKTGFKFHAKSLLVQGQKTPSIYLYDPKSGKNAKDFCRFGLTVSTKVAKTAVLRNKIKRRLRHAITKLAPDFAKINCDYVIIAKAEIVNSSYDDIIKDLKFCLKRIGL